MLNSVVEYLREHNYESSAIDTFLKTADQFLIAYAMASKFEVVTHEIPSDSRKRIKIPSVCNGLGIKCVTTFEMLRRERARFILGSTS